MTARHPPFASPHNRRIRGLREQRDAAIAAVNETFTQGRDYYKKHGDLLMIEVARHAATLWPDSTHLQITFIQGYSRARIDHDAFKRGE